MTKRILVGLDGSAQAWTALEYALSEHPDALITILTVIDPVAAGSSAQAGDVGYAEEWYSAEEARAEGLFEEARDVAGGVSIACETVVGRPAQALVEFAEDHDIDAIVMGSHGREGVSRILLGSVAETVVRRSPVPVTVVR